MRDITVNKADLVETIAVNKDAHKDTYDKALVAYEAKVREWLEENLERVRAGELHKVQRTCPYPVPEEHTDDYDRALQMLDWDLGDTYTLGEADFQCYVQNEWGWHRSFAANTTSYLVEQR